MLLHYIGLKDLDDRIARVPVILNQQIAVQGYLVQDRTLMASAELSVT